MDENTTENFWAIKRLQELQQIEIDKSEKTGDKDLQLYHNGRSEAFNDAEFVMKFAKCYTKDGFDKELANKLKETVYFDGNEVINTSQQELSGHGNLPDTCPKCNNQVDWDWDGLNVYDSQNTYDATCPKCGAEFSEILEVISWEEKKND